MITNSRSRNSLIWQIEYDERRAHIGGTIHISYRGYESKLNRFSNLFDQYSINRYFGETDIDDLQQGQRSIRIDRNPLSDQISPKQFIRLQKKLLHFTKIDLKHVGTLPPMLLSSLISSQLIESGGMSIDQILWQYATDIGIPVAGLESFAEQIAIYERIPLSYQFLQLKKMLRNLSKTRRSLYDVIDLYNTEKIHQLHQKSKDSLGPIRSLMLNERNAIIAQRIFNLLQQDNTNALFTVGAAHLSGEYGILHLLRLKGVRLTPLSKF